MIKRIYYKLKSDVSRLLLPPKMVYGYVSPSGESFDGTRVSNTAYFYNESDIQLSKNVFIWHYSILDGTEKININEGVQIGAWVGIFTHSSHFAIRYYGDSYQEVSEEDKRFYPTGTITIGEYTFVGSKSILMPGASVGAGCLVKPNSTVNDQFGDYCIISGNPAEKVGDVRTLDKIEFGSSYSEADIY